MRLLVTGGAGFTGANPTRAAVADPSLTDVRVLDELSTDAVSNLKALDVELVDGSILDDQPPSPAMSGLDAWCTCRAAQHAASDPGSRSPRTTATRPACWPRWKWRDGKPSSTSWCRRRTPCTGRTPSYPRAHWRGPGDESYAVRKLSTEAKLARRQRQSGCAATAARIASDTRPRGASCRPRLRPAYWGRISDAWIAWPGRLGGRSSATTPPIGGTDGSGIPER
jgi:hypothetical protein